MNRINVLWDFREEWGIRQIAIWANHKAKFIIQNIYLVHKLFISAADDSPTYS